MLCRPSQQGHCAGLHKCTTGPTSPPCYSEQAGAPLNWAVGFFTPPNTHIQTCTPNTMLCTGIDAVGFSTVLHQFPQYYKLCCPALLLGRDSGELQTINCTCHTRMPSGPIIFCCWYNKETDTRFFLRGVCSSWVFLDGMLSEAAHRRHLP